MTTNFSVAAYRSFSVRQGFTFSAMNRENIVGCGLQAHERRVRAQQEHPADGARRAAAYAGVSCLDRKSAKYMAVFLDVGISISTYLMNIKVQVFLP